MSEEQKMIWMFEQINGQVKGKYSIEVLGEYGEEAYVQILKHGVPSWTVTKTELLFDYITRDL